MIARLAAALFVIAALPASAQSEASDSRVRSVLYDSMAIVPVAGRMGYQSAILFSGDEKIENVAVGDSLGWQVTPNKRANVLFLKPVLENARTNMTVVTDKRVYLFDLLPSSKTGPLLYSLRFTYPAPPPLPLQTATATAPPVLNFAWVAKGSRNLFPSHMFDDGHSVYLSWPKGVALPAILAVGPDGSEGPVNFTARDDTMVVDGAPRPLVLRAGNDKATLTTSAVKTASAAPAGGKP